MVDNLDKVFVDAAYFPQHGMPMLEWMFDHFDKDKTKFILTDIHNGAVNKYRNAIENTYLPKCAEKKFKAEIVIPYAEGKPEPSIRELITKYGMNKFVGGDEWMSKILDILEEAPNLSCMIWHVNTDGKLLSTRLFNPEVAHEEKEIEKEKLKKMVKEETSRCEKVEKELLSMTEQAKINAQEIDHLRQEINQQKQEASRREEEILKIKKTEKGLLSMIEEAKINEQHHLQEIDQLKQNKALSTTFTSQELNQATQNFNDLLKTGEGEYGCVYKGTFRGTTVSIKKFKSQSKPGLSMLKQEVVILSTMRHPNLVTFIGACPEPPALVYEFLSRGNLRNYLNHAGNTMPLSWQIRTRIIGEVCVGLIFLHSNKPNPIIHGDLRPDNILLDANFTCKLSDFGLIKQADTNTTYSHPTRTLAYMDPEYFNTETFTLESDVYSFGVLILHLLTGECRVNISKTVQETIGNDNFYTIIDESAGKWPLQHAEEMAKIGVWCANAHRSDRPDLVNEVWPIVERLMKLSDEVVNEHTSPPLYFDCDD